MTIIGQRRAMPLTIATEGLKLPDVGGEDVETLHLLLSDSAAHTIGSGPFRDLRQTQEWAARRAVARDRFGFCWYWLRDSGTDRVVGNCGVFPGRTGSDEPEIGHLIDPPFRGQHYATEAAREVLAVARTCGIERLWATVRPGNKASLRILAALGFVEHHRTEDDQGTLIYLMSSGAAQQRPSPSLV